MAGVGDDTAVLRLLVRIAANLVSAAIGLIVSALLLPDFHLQVGGFLMAVVVLTVAQSLLTPWTLKITRRFAPALLGGFGLISTLIALLLAGLIPGGITVTSFGTWVLAALIVWLCVALGGWLLVALVLRKRVASRA